SRARETEQSSTGTQRHQHRRGILWQHKDTSRSPLVWYLATGTSFLSGSATLKMRMRPCVGSGSSLQQKTRTGTQTQMVRCGVQQGTHGWTKAVPTAKYSLGSP